MNITKEDIKHLGVSAAALAAGFIVKKTMEKGYQKVYRKDPPDKIEAEEPAWLELISWTIVTGIVTSAVKMQFGEEGSKRSKTTCKAQQGDTPLLGLSEKCPTTQLFSVRP